MKIYNDGGGGENVLYGFAPEVVPVLLPRGLDIATALMNGASDDVGGWFGFLFLSVLLSQ